MKARCFWRASLSVLLVVNVSLEFTFVSSEIFGFFSCIVFVYAPVFFSSVLPLLIWVKKSVGTCARAGACTCEGAVGGSCSFTYTNHSRHRRLCRCRLWRVNKLCISCTPCSLTLGIAVLGGGVTGQMINALRHSPSRRITDKEYWIVEE